ncbi:MAG: alcohol dehydrogenase catalytic domain-containing protein [Dehalococcoidia bacterium]|nr:alcohol dehydrogenase catalytic domain-containing protein [Dehalococcoidia bacterium]
MKALYVNLSNSRILATKVASRLSRKALFGPQAPLQFEERPPPPLPGPRYVRVRNRLAGICGSDIHFVRADGDPRIAIAAVPGARRMYLGHEVAGEVTEVGDGVRGLKPGARVTLTCWPGSCLGEGKDELCQHCAAGNYSRCCGAMLQDPLGIGGGLSEEQVVHECRLLPLPDDVTDEQAVLLEPAACGLRAALRRPLAPGDKALVIGCGTMGLMTLQALRAVQPDCEITALAQFDYQASMARRLGATNVIMLGSDTYSEVARITGGAVCSGSFGNKVIMGGFDAVYDCVGQAKTLSDALRWTRSGGTVVLLGVNLVPMRLDLTPVWYWEVDLLGTYAHGAEDWQGERVPTFELVIRLLREGKLDFEGFITHRFPLSQYKEAFTTAMDQRRTHAIKVVFDYRGGS